MVIIIRATHRFTWSGFGTATFGKIGFNDLLGTTKLDYPISTGPWISTYDWSINKHEAKMILNNWGENINGWHHKKAITTAGHFYWNLWKTSPWPLDQRPRESKSSSWKFVSWQGRYGMIILWGQKNTIKQGLAIHIELEIAIMSQ